MSDKLKTIFPILCALVAGIISALLAHTNSFAQEETAQNQGEPTPMCRESSEAQHLLIVKECQLLDTLIDPPAFASAHQFIDIPSTNKKRV